jgi:hypothetical protein
MRPLKIIDELLGEPKAMTLATVDYVVDLDTDGSLPFDGHEDDQAAVRDAKRRSNMIDADVADYLIRAAREELRERGERQCLALRVRRAVIVLDAWAAFLPPRISTEVLGDYLEDTRRRAADGQRLMIYVRALSALFWTAVNAVGYFLKEIGKRKAA